MSQPTVELPTRSGARPEADSGRTDGRLERAVTLGLAVVVVLWVPAYVTWPYGWDQGLFAWVGEVINRGGMPYRDAWELKGPLSYYAYAFAQRLFGPHLWSVRVLDLVLVAGTAVVLARVAARLSVPRGGPLVALLFVLWYASGSFWHTAQPDAWIAMLLVFGFAPLLLRSEAVRPHWFALAGLMIGLGCTVKPHYAAFLAIPALEIVLRPAALRARLVSGAALAAAFVAPLALTVAWFAQRGALDALIEVHLLYATRVYGAVAVFAIGSHATGLADHFVEGVVFVAAVPAILAGLIMLRRQPHALRVLAGWSVLAVATVVIQNRFFLYHWAVAIPPFALLATIALARGLEPATAPEPSARTFALALLVVIGGHAAIRPTFEVVHWAAWATGRTSDEAYYDHFGVPGDDIRAARYVQANSTPDDRVFIWGWNASILYMSERQSPSRFGYSLPLMVGPGTEIRETYRAEFMEDIRADPPLFIVDAPQADLLLGGEFDMRDFPAFAGFVARNYTPEVRFGALLLYRRTGGGAP